MRGLPSFQKFDLQAFLEGKTLKFLRGEVWTDYDTGAELGSKVVTQIVKDETEYAKPGISNVGEQITIKVPGVKPDVFAGFIPFETEVKIGKAERAVVYGDYNNRLSITGTVTEAK